MEGFQLPLVDRKSEICLLKDFLRRTREGQGGFLLLSGESGVGKTRLLAEAMREAENEGFYTLTSKCLPASPPLMPFYTMLKSIKMEHLLAQSSPRLDALFVVNKGGIILAKYEKREKNIDPDIFLGMVTAVENFIRDSISQIEGKQAEEKLGVMRHGEFTIVNMPGKSINVVALVEGVENEFLLADLSNLIERIETNFGTELIPILKELVESEKYTKFGVESRAGVFENVLLGLKRLSKEKPVLLIIDDLQWAESATAAMLSYLVREIANEAIGILGAVRSEDMSQLFGKLLENMKAEAIAEVLSLQPLDREGVYELIEAMLSSHVASELKEKIYTETEGNPLFVIELIKYLAQRGLRKEGEVWVYDGEIHIPQKIHELIREKIARLNDEELEILECASILGVVFAPDLLEKIVEMDKIKMLKTLSRLEKIHGLLRQENSKYRFEPAKARDVVYEGMAKELRRALHEFVGKILEEQGNEFILSAFYHYRQAGRVDKVKEMGFFAVEKLLERFGYEEALDVYKALYDVCEKNDERLNILEKMVEVCMAGGLYLNAQNYLEQILALVGSDRAKIGKIYEKRAEVFLKMGEHGRALECINLAFELGVGSEEEIARMLSIKGYIYERVGAYEDAIKCQEKALEIFLRHKREREAGNCYARLGSTCYYLGRYEESLQYLKAAEEIFREDLVGLSLVYNNMGMVYYELEDFERAKHYLEKTVEIKESIHDFAGLAIAKNNLGNVYFEKGEFEKAIALYLECKALCRKTGDSWMFVYNQIDLAEAYAAKSDWERYASAIAEAMERAKKIGLEKEVEEAKREIEERYG